jgi:hypothetical protein
VGADNEVDRARGQPGDRRCLLFLRHVAAEQAHRDREGRKALAERLVVLCGEHGRRNQHRDLFAPLDRLEDAAQRDFGLAVAHVADDETVHRPAGLHVQLDLCRGAELVERLLVRERRFQFLLPGRVGRIREARRGGAGRVDL